MQKLVIPLLVVVLVVCIEALESPTVSRTKRGFRMGAADRFSHGFGKRTDTELAEDLTDTETKRGFRMGAADRFSHGFGKRSDEDIGMSEGVQEVMSTEDLARLLASSPRLSYLVAKLVDTDEDGLISREELFPKFRK